jgi:hypothetical protein
VTARHPAGISVTALARFDILSVPDLFINTLSSSGVQTVAERLELFDGPLKGVVIEGLKGCPYGRYPDRIKFEFDGFGVQENMAGEPEAVFMAGAGAMIAEYDFDCGLGYFQFNGWTAKHGVGDAPENPE